MKMNASQLARLFFDQVFRLHGMPEIIISDRDRRFTSRFWKALMECLGTQLKLSTAFHPQTDGLAERYNRTIQEMIRSFLTYERRKDWDLLLTPLEFAYNRSTNRTTGYSPFELLYGQNPTVPHSFLAPHTSVSPLVTDFVVDVHRVLDNAKGQQLEGRVPSGTVGRSIVCKFQWRQ